MIDFLIMGAHKAGSTSLYHHLARHPDLFLPDIEENRFFTNEIFYHQGPDFLEPFYRDRTEEKLAGGKNVHVIYLQEALERVAEYNPGMKLIAILRNPIDRAYSAYWFARRNGWEECESFEDALELESERERGSYEERTELTYLGHGYYADQLERALDHFARDQLFVCLLRDLREDPDDLQRAIFDWLGVASEYQGMDATIHRMGSAMPRFPKLQQFIMARDTWYRKLARRLIPQRHRLKLQTTLVEPLRRVNLESFEYPPMDPDTRRELQEHFSSHNERLESLIGEDLSHWR